jgi:hypothetical protein
MNRVIGIVLAVGWLVAMAGLVQRDLLPVWTAQEAPATLMPAGEYQIGIFNQSGIRVGTTWVSSTPTVRSTTVLDMGRIAGLLPIAGRWRVTTDLSCDADHQVDQFKFTLTAAEFCAEVTAERLERDFSVIAKLGDYKKTMLLNADLSRFLAETLRPFTHLEDLHVGQRWRIRLLDLFALVRSQSLAFQTELAEVKRMETIEHAGRLEECFRVETPTATAWVDKAGRVLKQEVIIPLIGKWTLVDESVDPPAGRALAARRKGG